VFFKKMACILCFSPRYLSEKMVVGEFHPYYNPDVEFPLAIDGTEKFPMNWTHLVSLANSWSLLGQISRTSQNLHWTGTGLSHTGKVRSTNQDAFGVDNQMGLWVVADGMGGQAAGNVASELAVQTIFTYVRNSSVALPADSKDADAISTLIEATEAGREALAKRVSQMPEFEGMGTTIVAVLLCSSLKPAMAIAHVGDSRAYLIRDGQIRRLTKDHSLVEQLVEEGQITVKEARGHPRQNLLLKALGLGYDSVPETQILALESQDQVLLCTDGVTKMLSDDEILTIILQPKLSAEEICRSVIEEVNVNGGVDNSTALLISPCTET
jgi:protein phosphatase